MKLRAKILVVIASMMGILYVLVAAAVLPEFAGPLLRKSRERGEAAAQTLATLLEFVPREQRRALVAERRELFSIQPAPEAWAICDGQDQVVAWSRATPPPERLDDKMRDRMTVTRRISPERDDAGPWTLYVAPPPPDIAFEHQLWSLFLTMLVGTVMLGVAVYGLTLRLVINPVERLAAASRAAAGSRGVLPKVPQSERNDEIGALIRSYNAMVDEVNDLRVNLERRVHDAVHELEQAQKKLIVSERLSVSGKLAAGVAHEINNPLGGMLNAARSLQKKAEPGGRDAEYLELIVEGLGRVQNIVSSMLRFARPSNERARVRLDEVVEGALLFSKHRLSKHGIEVVREFPASPASVEVTGNRAELGQVCLNLVVNALDAMEEKNAGDGPKRLRFSLRKQDEYAELRVEDTGPGMNEETRRKAGEFFFSTKPEGRGTGLGLAIVQHILADHGGSLDIESEVGRGTTVIVRLPLEAPVAGTPQNQAKAAT